LVSLILNNEDIATDESAGITVLDFVRYHRNLKGTKIGCREGDCGACTILVGELASEKVKYRTMTSCLMPLANAAGKHIVTIEGINPPDRGLTPVQQAMVDESGTQCGFCTVGFVMSLTGFCLDRAGSLSVSSPSVSSPHVSKGAASAVETAISSIDGNICRCTGYKSIERAAGKICGQWSVASGQTKEEVIGSVVPEYFRSIPERLTSMTRDSDWPMATEHRPLSIVGGGTDVYVQKPEEMADSESRPVLYDEHLRGIREAGEYIEIGASATVTDLLESPVMQSVFPDLYKHLKLVSSTPIRNMATLAGNFVNASPIGDMTVWFLALDAEIDLMPGTQASPPATKQSGVRTLPLKNLYLGYKDLAKEPDEIITAIRFKKPNGDFQFNFEKVSKRTYLDIATVNTAISLRVSSGVSSLSVNEGAGRKADDHPEHGSLNPTGALPNGRATDTIIDAHVSAGGVAPIPLYLKETSEFLRGREIIEETITDANEIMQSEISPISDVRGTEEYKRLLLRQLFKAHFEEFKFA
jgi:xanthine dehydrogenase small subunit